MGELVIVLPLTSPFGVTARRITRDLGEDGLRSACFESSIRYFGSLQGSDRGFSDNRPCPQRPASPGCYGRTRGPQMIPSALAMRDSAIAAAPPSGPQLSHRGLGPARRAGPRHQAVRKPVASDDQGTSASNLVSMSFQFMLKSTVATRIRCPWTLMTSLQSPPVVGFRNRVRVAGHLVGRFWICRRVGGDPIGRF